MNALTFDRRTVIGGFAIAGVLALLVGTSTWAGLGPQVETQTFWQVTLADGRQMEVSTDDGATRPGDSYLGQAVVSVRGPADRTVTTSHSEQGPAAWRDALAIFVVVMAVVLLAALILVRIRSSRT